MKRKPRARIVEESIDSESILDSDLNDEDEPYGAAEETKVEFECKSAELVVIDEYQGNFLPMLLMLVDRVVFEQSFKKIGDSDRMSGSAETACRMQYFNAPIGFWEPAIERFFINVKL